MIVAFGDFEMFIAGDLHTPQEQILVDAGLLPDVDVYQANHHGSETSSSQRFVDALSPEVVIVSNGTHAGHRHPRKSTMLRLLAIGQVYQTNKFTRLPEFAADVLNTSDELIGDLDTTGNDGTILLEVFDDDFHVTLMTRSMTTSFPIEVH